MYRNVVNNNFGYVTVNFAYHGGTGFAIAYGGRANEYAWMPATRFDNCKSRDEAELKALLYFIEGSQKDYPGAYKGLTKNARVILEGFDAFEKGIKSSHKKNTELWSTVLKLFASGRNGFKFDLIRINETFSSAIRDAETYNWTALNRTEHRAHFDVMVKAATKEAKAQRAIVAKSTVVKPEAKTEKVEKIA